MPKSERLSLGKALEEGAAMQHVAEEQAKEEPRKVEGKDYDQLSGELDALKERYPKLARKFIEMNAGLKRIKDKMGNELWDAYRGIEEEMSASIIPTLGSMYLGRVKRLSQRDLGENEFIKERGKLRAAFVDSCEKQMLAHPTLAILFQGKEDLLHEAIVLEMPAIAQELESLDY